MNRAALLVDLDGTITDPGRGIIGAFRTVLEELGAEVPPFEALHWVVGPPLRASFRRMLGEGADVEAAILRYRVHYGSGGLFDADLIAGIPEALAGLRAHGFALVVCTSKPTAFARPIVEHFGLAPLFDAVHGAELDGSRDAKALVVAHALASERLSAAHCVMIGDRHHDVEGAAASGIPCIGVLWGYGSRAELEAAGAAAIVARPHEIAAAVAALGMQTD